MDLYEGTEGFNVFANGAAGVVIRRDRRADGNTTVFGNL